MPIFGSPRHRPGPPRTSVAASATGDIGQYAGNSEPQSQLGASARSALFRSTLAGQPGLVTARSRASFGSKSYTGTGLTIQSWVSPQGGTNTEAALNVTIVSPLKRNRSRSFGQFRGTPSMAAAPGTPGVPNA